MNLPYFSDDFVRKTRELLLCKIDNTTKYEIDQEDLASLKLKDDWFVRRFLIEKPSTTVEVAEKKLRDAMIWRHKFGINRLQDSSFPEQFYKIGALFPYLPDNEGNTAFILRIRANPTDKSVPGVARFSTEWLGKFIIYRFDKFMRENPNQKFSLLVDCHRSRIAHYDLKMARFLIPIILNYFYNAISCVRLYEMPWICQKVWLLIKYCLPEEANRRIQFVNASNISEYIKLENLPDFMNGQSQESYRSVPVECPQIDHWALELGFVENEKDARQLREYSEHLLSSGTLPKD